MQNSPPSPPTGGVDVAQQLNALLQTEARARFRALLPLIDDLVRQGVSYVAIAEALETAGISLKTASIRQALCRWRKRQTKFERPPSSHTFLSPSAATPPLPATRAAGSGAITSKADLVRLRKASDPIDLTQLAELGRQK